MSRFIMLCGPTCAGKTLGGEILSESFDYRHVEASMIMREFRTLEGNRDTIDDFASRSLREVPERVPLEVLKRFGGRSVVLTGLRSPLEVEAIYCRVDQPLVVFIDAPPPTRLARAIQRARYGHPATLYELERLDRLHARMGLGAIRRRAATLLISNTGTLDHYVEALSQLPR